VSLLVIACLQ